MKQLQDLNLSTRTINSLGKAEIITFKQLSVLSLEQLIEIKGISKKTAEDILLKIQDLKIPSATPDVFKIGLYIFTKKKYIKSEGRKKYIENKDLVNKLNGQIVVNGFIKDTKVLKNWCIKK